MQFVYNPNNQLSEIINSVGQRAAFTYEDGYLVTIERDQLPDLTLEYKNDLVSAVTSAYGRTTSFRYPLSVEFQIDELQGITQKVTGSDSNNVLFEVGISHDDGETVFTYENGKEEHYEVDEETEQITRYYETLDDKVLTDERYTYETSTFKSGNTPDRTFTEKTTVVTQKDNVTQTEITCYNPFSKPIEVTSSKETVVAGAILPIENVHTLYTYNDSQMLVKTVTTATAFGKENTQNTHTLIETYRYNLSGDVVRKESYVEGEEQTLGISIEEHVYNDKGVEISSCSYNSLDPSSKFYTEQEVDEDGRVTAEIDERGEHKTSFTFDTIGNVRAEKLPNGSNFVYGRAKDGAVTAGKDSLLSPSK